MTVFLFRLLAWGRNIAVACFMTNMFCNGIVLDYISYSFGGQSSECTVKALEESLLEMYSQSTRGPELFFLYVVKCFFFYIRYFSKTTKKKQHEFLTMF